MDKDFKEENYEKNYWHKNTKEISAEISYP